MDPLQRRAVPAGDQGAAPAGRHRRFQPDCVPRREHSRKPDELRERIVRIAGDVPRAELFARQRAPGWSAWGNELACDFPLLLR